MRCLPTDRKQQTRARRECRIAHHQQLASIEEVGNMAAEEKQHEPRQELRETYIAEIEWPLRDVIHLPSHSYRLHLECEHDKEPRRLIQHKIWIGESNATGKTRVLIRKHAPL